MVWLGILAVVSLLEVSDDRRRRPVRLQMYRQVMTTIETVERVHIAPLRARVDGILDEVQTITEKVKHAQESVSDALRHVAGTGTMVAGAVKSKTWPIVGILQGLKTAANSVMRNGKKDHSSSTHYGAR